MMVDIVTFLLIEGLIAMGVIIWRLMRKIERQEKVIFEQEDKLQTIKVVIDLSKDRLEEIDASGAFQSDDEVGWFFQNMKAIQQELSQIIK